MDLYQWALENEALVMFVIIPAIGLPVGWLIKKFENN